jgi:hypothetical protein
VKVGRPYQWSVGSAGWKTTRTLRKTNSAQVKTRTISDELEEYVGLKLVVQEIPCQGRSMKKADDVGKAGTMNVRARTPARQPVRRPTLLLEKIERKQES